MKTQVPAIIFFLLLLIVSYACTKQSTPNPESQPVTSTVEMVKVERQ